jgi:hypothetical protein
MNAAARLAADCPVHEFVRQFSMASDDEFCILMHSAEFNYSPSYLNDITTPFAAILLCKSASHGTFDVLKMSIRSGRQAFSFAGPIKWKNLPINFRQYAN